MKIGNLEKPTFNKVREEIILLIQEVAGVKPEPWDLWTSVADGEIRAQIVKEFVRRMEQKYSFEIVLREPLKNNEGSVEGVIRELYHVFSTMFLVEVINSKIRSGQGNVEL